MDQHSNYPNDPPPLLIEVNAEKIEKVTREFQNMTDSAKRLEGKIQGIVQVARTKAEAEEEVQKGNRTSWKQRQEEKKALATTR